MIYLCVASALLYLQGVPISAHSQDGFQVLNCSTCACVKVDKPDEYAVEFQIICNGTGKEMVLMTDEFFSSEKTPEFDEQVYVLVNRFSSIRISLGFFRRWIPYSSSALDIWFCPNITIDFDANYVIDAKSPPTGTSVIGLHEVGIESLPSVMSSGKLDLRITLTKSLVTFLNLGSLTRNTSTLRTFRVKQCDVRSLSGRSVPTADTVNIEDSVIGTVGPLSLSFVNEEGERAVVKIRGTTVNYVEDGAIIVYPDVHFSVADSFLVHLSTIDLKERSYLRLANNTIGLKVNGLSNITCNSSRVSIVNNTIIPLTKFSLGSNLTPPALLSNFLNSSCPENEVLYLVHSDSKTQTEEDSNPSLSREPIYANCTSGSPFKHASNHQEEKVRKVPLSFLYVLIGLIGFLMLVTCSLVYMLVRAKHELQRVTSKPSDKVDRSIESFHFLNAQDAAFSLM